MVVKGAKVVLPGGTVETDVRIEEGRIAEIGTGLTGKAFEARGKYLLPAMVDLGIRMRDGRLRGGTLQRLSRKAKAHGFGTVAVSALCAPRIDNEITLEFAKSQAERCEGAKILTLLSGVKEDGGLSDCSILLKDGAVGIEFESHIDGNLIRRLMEYARMHGTTLFCRANDPALQGDGVMHEGQLSGSLGLGGVPALAESSQVARIGEFARTYDVDVVILGASTPRTLRICRQNPRLHAQVSLHHLLLDDKACDNYDTSGKIWPPLRDEKSREAMVQSLREGAVSLLTSLHSPVSGTAKDAVFAEAAYGVEGLSHFLPMLYTGLIEPGILSWQEAVAMVAANPAERIGMSGSGRITEGAPAEMVLFDPEARVRIETLSSPYRGRTFRGAVASLPVC